MLWSFHVFLFCIKVCFFILVTFKYAMYRICVSPKFKKFPIQILLHHVFVIYFFFVWDLSSHSKNFHSYGDVTILGEGLQILTNARHSWAVIIEGFLACHTHCDTGHPYFMVISEDPRHLHLFPSVWQWSCHYLFLRLRIVAAGIRTPNLLFAGLTL